MSTHHKPLEIDRILSSPKLKNRVYRVGVELEGGWTKLPAGVNLEHDGSVHIPSQNGPDGRPVRFSAGELSSVALEPEKLDPWMEQSYPQIVNETCGLHVHQSFLSAWHYQLLMVPEYQATVIEYLKRWAKDEGLEDSHPIWPRLEGKSEFCKLEYWADLQASVTKKDYRRDKPGHRYTAINYCAEQHETIECRVLPMMKTAAQGIRAVHRVLQITNAVLLIKGAKEAEVKAAVKLGSIRVDSESRDGKLVVRRRGSDVHLVEEIEGFV